MSASKRKAMALALAIAAGLPIGWVLAFMATPLLWRLEPVLHMELAGHSGPSDWVFLLVWAIVIPTLFFVFKKVLRRSSAGGPAITRADSARHNVGPR